MASKGQVVAYLRISHRDQSLDTQRAKIEAFGHVDRIFEETASTKNARAVLTECMAYLREGDTLPAIQRRQQVERRVDGWVEVLQRPRRGVVEVP
jgi:DNA invertase Pin-like site-specific DNA recombinase